MVNRFVVPRLPRATLRVLVAMAVLTLGAQNTHAQLSSWGGGTGYWNSTNWTPTPVPPNSATTNVSITGTSGTPSVVTLNNLSPTIQNLSLDSFSTLSISGGYSLYDTGASIANAGEINVGSSGASTLYVDASTVTLSGAGTVNLNNAGSYLEGYSGSNNLVNKDNTIQGQGYIYNLASFQNQGTVNANVSGGILSIEGVTNTTNSGTFQASSGSTLFVNGTLTNYIIP